VVVVDTAQDIVMKGDRAIYYEDPEYAMVTERAELIQIDESDSLFVHADTILTMPDTAIDRRLIKAYFKVKFYRSDFQGKCDSLTYSEIDSVFRLFGEPVLWSEENQLTAEYIELHTSDRKMDRIEMMNAAFIISMEDSVKFNQIKGRDMTGFIIDNEIEKVNVNGNSETIYYGKDEEVIVGVNKAVSSNLIIQFLDNKVKEITYLTEPSGTSFPLERFSSSESRLPDFKWYEDYRPRSREEIFIWKRNSAVADNTEPTVEEEKISELQEEKEEELSP
jgi:hypothetical protein